MFNSRSGLRLQGCRASARKTYRSGCHVRNSSACAGFSYIEVLLSLAIFSVGMLGFAHVQVFNLRLANESLVNSQANIFIESAREQVLAAGDLIDKDRWQEKVKSSLPEGQLEMNQKEGIAELGLSWMPLFSQGKDVLANQLTVLLVNKNE